MLESIFSKVTTKCREILPGLLMILGLLLYQVGFAVAEVPTTEEEVTRAETLDWSMWMSNAVETNSLLLGEWKTERLGVIRISPTSMANNTYFVETGERMVPCFQIDVRGRHYLLIGARASESLEMIPEVYCYSVTGDLLEMSQLSSKDLENPFENLEAFVRFASADSIDRRLIPAKFERI